MIILATYSTIVLSIYCYPYAKNICHLLEFMYSKFLQNYKYCIKISVFRLILRACNSLLDSIALRVYTKRHINQRKLLQTRIYMSKRSILITLLRFHKLKVRIKFTLIEPAHLLSLYHHYLVRDIFFLSIVSLALSLLYNVHTWSVSY